ncbi:hypothetical protein [Bradyrhizobium sp. 25ACV]
MPMPQPRQIGCGNQWHQRSAGTADVPKPVDLEWPRRATVGAIAMIGVAWLASFAEGTGVLYCGERPPRTICNSMRQAKLVCDRICRAPAVR